MIWMQCYFGFLVWYNGSCLIIFQNVCWYSTFLFKKQNHSEDVNRQLNFYMQSLISPCEAAGFTGSWDHTSWKSFLSGLELSPCGQPQCLGPVSVLRNYWKLHVRFLCEESERSNLFLQKHTIWVPKNFLNILKSGLLIESDLLTLACDRQ